MGLLGALGDQNTEGGDGVLQVVSSRWTGVVAASLDSHQGTGHGRLAAYEKRREVEPENALEAANRSTALLCLGRWDDALEGFRYANRLKVKEVCGESLPYLEHIGTAQWILGRRKEAVESFTSAVNGVLDGTIKFADNAGGVSQGLLLWYAGVALRDSIIQHWAASYLQKLSQNSRIKYWPGPLATFVLQKCTIPFLLLACGKSENLEEVHKKAKIDLLTRRQLVQTLFYVGVDARRQGRESECYEWMAQCAGLENPVIELEWYLACVEVSS